MALDIPAELESVLVDIAAHVFDSVSSDHLTDQDAGAIVNDIQNASGSAAGTGTWVNGSPCK